MKIKTIALYAGILAMGGAAGLSSCSKSDTGAGQQVPTLQTLTVERSNATLEKSYPATLRGKTDIDIRPQVTGFITKVHVDEGQRVHKGQVLFTLDQVQYQAAVDQAIAAVNAARTSVTSAQITADNKKRLLDKNIISQSDWQIADNQLAAAKAQLSQAQAALTSARKNLAYTVVTAPSDGVVGTIPTARARWHRPRRPCPSPPSATTRRSTPTSRSPRKTCST